MCLTAEVNNRLKYQILLQELKDYIVSKQDFEFACHVRGVEVKHFLPDKWVRPKTTSEKRNSKLNALLDYPDFDPNKFLSDLEECVKKHGGDSIDIIRDFKINQILNYR